MTIGGAIQVRARWSRPAYCRDDWLRVWLPNGPSYFCRTEVVEMIDDAHCWVRAVFVHEIPDCLAVEVRFVDYTGAGSLDSVPLGATRPVPKEEES